MSVTNQEEYKTKIGETISIQLNDKIWEVSCWDKNDECRWYKEYLDKNKAYEEFNRWKS